MKLPIEPLWNSESVAELLGISRSYLRVLLHRAQFPTRRYRRHGQHPRLVRALNAREIRLIAKKLKIKTEPKGARARR